MVVSLVDAFTRHQVYLESYKLSLEATLDPMLASLRDDIVSALAEANVDKLNDLTRKELNALIRRIQIKQLRRNNAYRAGVLTELRLLAEDEAETNRGILEHTEDNTLEAAWLAGLGAPLLGMLALRRNKAGRSRLWALVSNTPDPASGLTPDKMIRRYLGYVQRNVKDIITRGYANGWTTRETINAIVGTKARRYKDGFMAQARRAGASALHTTVQHISSRVQAGVASLFFKQYEWVSILDQFTTKICQRRDGLQYDYGDGPLPPAHYKCRSRTVPVRKGSSYAASPATYAAWHATQPPSVRRDMGVAKGGKFRPVRPLTLAQLKAKLSLIIAA